METQEHVLPLAGEIKKRLEQKGWQQQELADVIGISLKHINQILGAKVPLNYEIASKIAEILGETPIYWMDLYLKQNPSEGKSQKDQELEIRKQIYEHMPILEMQKRKILPKHKSSMDLQKSVLNFWGWKELDFSLLEGSELPAFRRSPDRIFNDYFTLTWYHYAKKKAGERHLKKPFQKEEFLKFLDSLPSYLPYPERITEFLNQLQNLGVIFFILPHFKQTYIDGAAFLSGSHPVVVLTLRFSRLDSFWFYLLHELGHVAKHMDQNFTGSVTVENSTEGEKEKEANEFAGFYLKKEELYGWARKFSSIPDQEIEKISRNLSLHPASVKGILARGGFIQYNRIHSGNVDMKKLLDEKYFVEG
ncbi:MAG: helix-turn-helix domain-containing protein [Leptospiraceae bacterium]|nr:helix-turn-helix domain-containing protein [Leptospiraceae bacterium]